LVGEKSAASFVITREGTLDTRGDQLFPWQQNVRHKAQTHPILILTGNTKDLYCLRARGAVLTVSLDEFVTRLFCPPFQSLRRFDAYNKVSDLTIEAGSLFSTKAVEEFGTPGFIDTTNAILARSFSELESSPQARMWLMQYAHNLLPFRSSYSAEEGIRLIAFQRLAERMAPENRLILVYLSDTQIPLELSQNAHRVAILKIPTPEFDERSAFWSSAVPALADPLAKLTDGMAVTTMQGVLRLARRDAAGRSADLASMTVRDWERLISHFKFGTREDHYQRITPTQLDGAKAFFVEGEGVQGQDHAVGKTIRMLWMARTNLASLLHSGGSAAPRGCLFFCGASGTGKTMLAKKLAKFVYGSEDAFLRIDMSEYQQDFTVSKLIGAPPGYVGFEMGGVLTSAVAERPFQVILFDEIEKAHPRVFDLFLQLLSDGRLTDNRGQTVYFSQSIIIFTSNLGTRASEITLLREAQASGQPERVRAHFVRCVRDFFRLEISRPELLNRIGNNIVPFEFLDKKDVLLSTVRHYLQSLQRRFKEEYDHRNIRMQLSDDLADFLVETQADAIREFGGRGVMNTLAEYVLPELAREVLGLQMKSPDGLPSAVTITLGVEDHEGHRKVRAWR